MFRNLSPQMILRIEELVDASYSGRDELYAAADTLDDAKRRNVCRQLAEHLAGHASELQQILIENGEEPIDPIDMYAFAEAFFNRARANDGDAEVLRIAEKCERTVKERFDDAIDSANNEDTAELLRRQRDDIEFGEDVLRSMREPPTSS